jgi:hypothetical protein
MKMLPIANAVFPNSAVNTDIVEFDGTSGRKVKDSGITHAAASSAIATAQNGEVMLTPRAAAISGLEGTMFYCSTDDHVYVGCEP